MWCGASGGRGGESAGIEGGTGQASALAACPSPTLSRGQGINTSKLSIPQAFYTSPTPQSACLKSKHDAAWTTRETLKGQAQKSPKSSGCHKLQKNSHEAHARTGQGSGQSPCTWHAPAYQAPAGYTGKCRGPRQTDRQTDKQTRTTLSEFALCLSFVRAGVMMMVMMMAMDGRNSTLC